MKLVVARCAVAIVALVVVAAPVAVSGQTSGAAPSVVPVENVAGSTGGELVGEYFAQVLALPADASPFTGTASVCLHLGLHAHVLSPSEGIENNGVLEASCKVTAGRPVVLVTVSADCSTNEPPPYHAVTPKQQRACVKTNLASYGVTSIMITVDGGTPVEIHRHKFFALSPQERTVYPENPPFDATPGPATFVAGGYAAQVRGMHVGEHTIEGSITVVSDGQTEMHRVLDHITVVPRG